MTVSYKTKHIVTRDPVFLFLDIYPRELRNLVFYKTWKFIAILFVIVKNSNFSNVLSEGEWVNCGISPQWHNVQQQKKILCSQFSLIKKTWDKSTYKERRFILAHCVRGFTP